MDGIRIKEYFTIEVHSTIDKFFNIYGPEITLKVDFDDVDHAMVEKQTKRIVKILNESWG